jgi:CRP-like cAMP-binding protein
LRRGAPITHFFLVLSGLVSVVGKWDDEDTAEASCLFPGDYFGEERFLSGFKDSSKTYACIKDVSLCLIPGEIFEDVKEFGKVREQILIDMGIKEGSNSHKKKSISFKKYRSETLESQESHATRSMVSGKPPEKENADTTSSTSIICGYDFDLFSFIDSYPLKASL